MSTITTRSVVISLSVIAFAAVIGLLLLYVFGIFDGISRTEDDQPEVDVDVRDATTIYSGSFCVGYPVVILTHRHPGSIDWSAYRIMAYDENNTELAELGIMTLGGIPYDNLTNHISMPGYELVLTVLKDGSLNSGIWLRIKIFRGSELIHTTRLLFVA